MELGREVGYQVRFENCVSDVTRIKFETEGILLRQLIQDPSLRGIQAVIFDEFHERHLYGDITLARALDIQEKNRPDLLIAVMSATLDAGALEDYLRSRRGEFHSPKFLRKRIQGVVTRHRIALCRPFVPKAARFRLISAICHDGWAQSAPDVGSGCRFFC